MELVTTKLSLPRIEKDILPRPRLLRLANEITDKKLISLIAPGGYGKTVLMVQLAETVSTPSIWYQLDSYDNDLVTFLKYLLTGIRRLYPDFGKEAFKLIDFGEANLHQHLLIASFINDLVYFAKDGLFIILDDFHVITEPKVEQFIQELLSYLPQGTHFMIASRSQLPFSVERYKFDGAILMIGVDHLRFREEEISDFFAQRDQIINQKTSESLASATNGWPAALKLIKNPNHNESQPLSYEDNQAIYNYLVAPLFNQLPRPIQSFLVNTSIIEGFTPEFCNALLNRKDAEEVIEYLESQHIFLIPLTGAVNSYRYHDLMRNFLQNKIGTSRRNLLCRAAELTHESGKLIQSCEYLLKAGVIDEYLPLLIEAGREALQRGQWQTVARWLKGVAQEKIQACSWLSYYQAEVEIYQSHLDQADRWVKNAALLFWNEEERVGCLITQILEAKIFRCRGKYLQCLELLEKVETEIPPEQHRKRLEIYIEKYVTCCLMGKFKECEALLIQALDMVKPLTEGYLQSYFYEGLGNVNYMMGNYPKALQMYQQGAEVSPDQVLPSYYAQDNISSIYQDWGQLDRALEYAKRNLEQKEKLKLIESLPSAYHQLAGIYIDRGELKSAEQLYRKAVQMVKANNNDHFALSTILVYLAWCMSLQGKLSEALNLMDEAYQESKEQSGLALAVYLEIGAIVLIRAEKMEAAEKMLLEAVTSLERMGFQKSLCNCYAHLTVINDIKGFSEQAEKYAVKCLEIAARLNLVQMFITHFEQLKPVLQVGLEKGIRVTFIQYLMTLLGDRSLSILSILAVHKEQSIRLRTVIPLAEIGTSKAKAIMKGLMNDSDHEVATTAKHLGNLHESFINHSSVNLEEKSSLLEFRTLGQFRVFIDGVEINPESWRTVKVRDLLAYLIHNVEPVNICQIIEDLWSQFDKTKATANFHTTLYQLRQRLKRAGYENLVEYGGRYYFIQPTNYCTDYQRFENLIKALLKNGVSKENAAFLEEALSLYCGNYLADLDYEWIIPKQERLKQLYSDTCMALSHFYLELQEFDLAIRHLRSLQVNNPYNEEVSCRLMTAYAGMGDRAAVLKEFERLKRELRKDLGLEPSENTIKIYHRLYH